MTENNAYSYRHELESHGNVDSVSQKQQRIRFIVLTLIVVSIVGYLVLSGMHDTMGYYLTVSELLALDAGEAQELLRVSGNVAEGSVIWDAGGSSVTFDVLDEGQTSVPVTFRGSVPDTFQPGQKVILEGTYADGVFTATQMMTTCASKYE